MDLNLMTFSGRLASDPRRADETYGTETRKRCFFTLMSNSGRKNPQTNQPVDATAFNCVLKGGLVDSICQHTKKGDSLTIVAEFTPYRSKPVSASTKQPIQDAMDSTTPLFTVKQVIFGPKAASNRSQNFDNQPQGNFGGNTQTTQAPQNPVVDDFANFGMQSPMDDFGGFGLDEM